MFDKYPRIFVDTKYTPKGLCKICGENRSDSTATIQTDMFRGDDDVYNVHKKCIDDLGHEVFMMAESNHAET